ncbi:uncharacterized protein J4E84_007260 [Alternaria hordeiaustralica]|uniref:uncharacterized protein n=1 Tax=Alternaria hordeiaustralica TaxID=1187925 RepID=UPI0020C38117|nr:uncharacterized protein J4E84_007260 [Alternaria hordeiaustralica]KAI4682795.1 hypothetical protein J4E84_007260 [Alternaria hordeiaustralica]
MYPSTVSRISPISPRSHKDQPANAYNQYDIQSGLPTLNARQPDSITDTHLRTGPAHTVSGTGSGAVLGLPSTIDPCLLGEFDLTQFNLNEDYNDDTFGLDFDWIPNNGLDVPMDEVPLNGGDVGAFQLGDSSQENQAGQGFVSAPLQDKLNDQSHQWVNQNAVGQMPTDLVPVEPHGNQPNDPTYDFSQDLGLWDTNFEMPSQFLDTTPGFSAFPGGNTFMSDMSQYPVAPQPSQTYPDPFTPMYPVQPYYQPTQQPYPQQHTGYVAMPTEQYTGSHQFNKTFPSSSRQSSRPVPQLPKRKRTQSGFGSDDDAYVAKQPPRQLTHRTRSSVDTRHDSNVSCASSVSKPVKVAVVRAGEKPKKCDDKPWVRVNNTTRGETTRTARINQHAEEGRKYKTKPLPHGNWSSSSGFKFEYSQNNGMHEFKKRTMTAREIHEYITQYPGDNLRIWIQPVASDSARRYASASHSHCRFDACPMRVYTGKGTAEVGNYRVAFDEKHRTYGTGVVDPYDCVGFAHLYCMERFLDFAYICQVANVKVDQRVGMEKEPKGHFASAFGSKHHYEAALASKFIEAASKGRLGDTHEFSDYPVHEHYKGGHPKPHERTLIYALYGMNMKHRAKSQMKQFILQRKIRPGSFPVHRGDMEVKLVDKKIEKMDVYIDYKREGSKKEFDYSAYYDVLHPEINQRIAEMEKKRDEFIKEDEAGIGGKRKTPRRTITFVDSDDERQTPSRKRSLSKKRQATDSDSSDDERPALKRTSTARSTGRITAISDSEDSDSFEKIINGTKPRQGSRAGLRKKPRINYSEPSDLPIQAQVQSAAPPPSSDFMANYAPAIPFDDRKQSLSAFFPANNDPSWSNLDLDEFSIEGMDDVCMDEEAVDALIGNNAKYRRQSSTFENGPWASGSRTASFNAQPVSGSREFRREDPPRCVAEGEVVEEVEDGSVGRMRRSKRLAGKGTPASFVAG